MHHNKFLVPIVAATLLAGASGGAWLAHAQKQARPRAAALPAGRVPPAGDYGCSKTIWGYSGARNIDGSPMMTLQYIPSVLGTLKLDGRGGYLSRKKPGRYRFNSARREFAFVSGPLAGWPVIYEVSSGTPMLRLAATKDDKVVADARIGEHSCRLRSDAKFPDSPPPASSGGPASISNSAPTSLNGGARGTLTFRQEWGSDKIVDLNLASGALRSRFEGRDPFRSASGETVFVNNTGALVIAGAGGTATTTIAVPEGLDRPDSPAVSPDGSRIAFHVQPVYYDSRVLVATRTGKIIAEYKDVTEPNWTPDGRLLVAKSTKTEGAKPGIFLSDADLKQIKRIDPDLDSASQPAASPDGRRIAFVHHGHIWLMNLDGGGVKQLSSSNSGEKSPSWSPDGKWLAAAKERDGVVLLISASSGKIITAKSKDNDSLQSSGRLNWR